MKWLRLLVKIILWPGTKITARLGIDPDSEMGLLRSMFNTLIWTALGLFIVLVIVL